MNSAIKSTSLCFETIKAVDGILYHVPYHEARLNQTRKELFNAHMPIRLSTSLQAPLRGTYRIRVVYRKEIESIESIPYVPREFQTFMCHEVETISYAHKFCDRSLFDIPCDEHVDDVLFIVENELKDTRIANIALLIDGVWKTPMYPLLKGTTRARLLASGWLLTERLERQSLQKAEKFAIMNALIGFKVIENVRWIKE